jgi:hypothetical protein
MVQRYNKPSDALKVSKQKSWLETERSLNEALERLRAGKPLKVEMNGRNFNERLPPVTLICKEAGVNQSGVYKHHEKWLQSLRKTNDSKSKNRTSFGKSRDPELEEKLRAERALVKQLESDKEKLARINYGLVRRDKELSEENQRLRAKVADMMKQLNR